MLRKVISERDPDGRMNLNGDTVRGDGRADPARAHEVVRKMAERDYYEVLGVARDATPEAIKKAYRGLARKLHPDVNPGDKTAEAKFKEVQQAYDILSEPEKRSRYDRFGDAAFEGMAAAGPRAGAQDFTFRFGEPGFENVDFSQFFGSMGRGGLSGDRRGRRNRWRRPLRGPARPDAVRPAGSAAGGPADGGASDHPVPHRRPRRRDDDRGPARDGQTETLVAKIPPGVETGSKVRLKGRGEPGPKGAPAGDLIIRLTVQPHPYFRREGRDLIVEVPITVGEAILGAKIDVPSPDGLKSLTIPAGTSSGQKLRLRGQGVPASGGLPAGDLFVVLKIVVPKKVDEESRRLIEEFSRRNPYNPRAGLW